jgi:hypothetical protein
MSAARSFLAMSSSNSRLTPTRLSRARGHLEDCAACAEDRDSLRALRIREAGPHLSGLRSVQRGDIRRAQAPIQPSRVRPAPITTQKRT